MAETIRCSECSTPFKGVPTWLATAKVTFTCTSCPKKGTRGPLARFEPAVEARPSPSVDLDGDMEDVDMEALDEDAELELGDEDLESLGDDKEV
jgi:hypothetical protein